MLVAESVAGDCPGGGSAVPTAAWMRSALHVTAARAHVEVRAAGLLTVGAGGVVGGDAVAGRPEPAAAPDGAGDLRELGRAVAAGRASAEHVRVACRAMTRHPGHLRAAHRPELAEALTEHACAWAPETADRLARYLLAVLSPDGSDRYDSAALDRRSFAAAVDPPGCRDPRAARPAQRGLPHGRGRHPRPAGPARLPRPGTDETGAADPVPGCKHAGPSDDVGGGLAPPLQAPDMRTLTQRRHDALDTLVRAGVAHLAGCDTAGGVGAALAWLIVTTTPDQLAAGAQTGPDQVPTPDQRARPTTSLGTGAHARRRRPGRPPASEPAPSAQGSFSSRPATPSPTASSWMPRGRSCP